MLNLEKRLIVLDRDGVINVDSIDYIKSVHEFYPIEGSLEAIARLNRLGFKVYIATNQSGIGRGYFSRKILEDIHQKLKQMLTLHKGEIESIYYCPHAPVDRCRCRKPLPGLLEMLMTDINQDLKSVPLVGDSLRDLQAGWSVGCEGILVKTGKGNYTLERYKSELSDILVCENLAAVVDHIEQHL